MLRGSVVPFAVQYERRGRQAGLARGLEQGLEQGRKEIRSLHIRMARALRGTGVGALGGVAAPTEIAWPAWPSRRHRGRSQDRRGAACKGGRSGRV